MTQKRKGRLPKAISEKKQLEGRRLFINGLTEQEIADVLELHIDTIKKFSKDNQWEDSKKMHSVSISEMKAEVLNTFTALKNGETPKLSADQITKVVSAFEKLNDRKKNVAYAVENYDLLFERLIKKAGEATTKKEKNERLHIVKYISSVAGNLVNDLYIEALHE